ncbi:MAG: polyprenyl synthetase family protein [Lachnospiraceae bacterium]|nr:polyprenyl synthetase family protein [Lachnospiraceae bacterium]
MTEAQLNELTKQVDDMIYPYFPKEEGPQKRIFESMNYSFEAGGKRIRPMLMMESFLLLGGSEDETDIIAPFMAAMEMVHTYSLIHDDLPAVDDDDFRRGKPTNHKKFGETTAIFAGDAMLNYAFETMLDDTIKEADDVWKAKKLRAMQVLARNAGAYGMLAGQMVDYLCENKKDVTLEDIMFIHEKKTAALIQAPLVMGAIFAGAPEEKIARMEQAGYLIGLSFQIQDDILDCVGNEEKLGKKTGSDARKEKSTYVTIKGLKEAKEDQVRMSHEARGLILSMATGPSLLPEIVEILISRES